MGKGESTCVRVPLTAGPEPGTSDPSAPVVSETQAADWVAQAQPGEYAAIIWHGTRTRGKLRAIRRRGLKVFHHGIFLAEERGLAEDYGWDPETDEHCVVAVAVRLRRPLRLEPREGLYAACERLGVAVPPRDRIEQPSDLFPSVQAAGYDGVHSPHEGLVTTFDADRVRVIAD